MGRVAILFFFLAVAVIAFGALPTVLSDLDKVERVRAQGPEAGADLWPTFNVDAPRTPAPQVSFTDPSGRRLTLGDFRGQVVLVNFWATWCEPCRREMPSLLRLERALSSDDFRLITISTDRQAAAIVRPFLEANGLGELRAYFDPDRRAYAAFGSAAIPTTILIDRRGREIGRYRGWAEWDNPATAAQVREILRR